MSEYGVFVETTSPISIPLYRLVQFQLDRGGRDAEGLPQSLRHGRLLSAVYRIHQPTRPGARQGLALRLMVDPRRRRATSTDEAGETLAIREATESAPGRPAAAGPDADLTINASVAV